jgi:hypothetical protein
MSKSNGIVTKKIGDGQKIMSAYPQDTAGGHELPNTRGGKFGGSTTNLGHSLNGASAVQEGAKSK